MMANQTTGFHSRLRAARAAAGLKQRDVAARLDVDVMQVSRWERGVTTPLLSTTAALAEILGVSVDWLVSGVDHGATACQPDATVKSAEAAG